jgi:energy-coupling factor transport system permease/ATP-binding protein
MTVGFGDLDVQPIRSAVRGMAPAEMAQAAVIAALVAAAAILGTVIPFAGALSVLGSVPMGLLAYRYRLSVLVAATVAGCTIAFLVAGAEGVPAVAACAYVGGLTGIVKRRGMGALTVAGVGAVAGGLLGAGTVAALAVLAPLRQLTFASLTANVDGTVAVLSWIPHLGGPARLLKSVYAMAMANWPVLIGASSLVGICIATLIGWWALSRVLNRLAGIPDVHKLDAPGHEGPVGPVPARLDDVTVRYPDTDSDALGPVSLAVEPGEHLAITGSNGSGKTTLMLVLAGREPTAGTIERAGTVGLGRVGGTAVIMQHPESQVLGTRVADDVVWGLPPGTATDVAGLLAEVGLDGMADRDTNGLSGGELQRLAVAAALARQPSLLIADEVTSMVDPRGRESLMTVLSGLTRHRDMSLAHITHYRSEADAADRVLRLTGNGAAADHAGMVLAAAAPSAGPPATGSSGSILFELEGIWHEYGRGGPWAKTALRDVNLVVEEGDGVLIHGDNGSGKSTLAWIMAGLIEPTAGRCLIDGRPASEQVGAVALSFQAARLQLMRERVGLEIASAALFSAHDRARIESALMMVGLDPELADRRIDQLSGGQMRRVVLAGLLIRSPRALILDEPLAGLDAASAEGLVRLLAELRRETGLTVIVISHDFSGLEQVCPRSVHLTGGTVSGPTSGTALGGRQPAEQSRRRGSRSPVLLMPVPGDSAVHRMWAGTKLVVVAAIAALLAICPGWAAIAVAAVLAAGAMRWARIPRGAVPTIPRWAWVMLLVTVAAAAVAGGSPVLTVASVGVPLGGLLHYLQFLAMTVIVLGLGALVSWTTNVAEIAPALARLGKPLRRLRVPTEAWSVAVALGLRAFPMLVEEFRVLYAARRLRPHPVVSGMRARARWWFSESVDVLAAVITVALRRGDEMGDAITARGGYGQLSAAQSRPGRIDYWVMTSVLVLCAVTAVLQFVYLGVG